MISLEQLILYDFTFNNFVLKLKNLKILTLKNCSNISLDLNIGINMKKLVIDDCKINIPEILLKFPELEECIFKNKDKVFSNIIDFKSLVKLKKILINSYEFSKIDNNYQIEDIQLYDIDNFSNKNIIKKICSFKTIKNINLELKSYKDIIIEQTIPYKSVSNLTIIFNCYKYSYNTRENNIKTFLINLFKIFPNLLKLRIDINNNNNWFCRSLRSNFKKIKIEENINSKINEIFLYYNHDSEQSINIYCQSFETIKLLHIKSNNNINNLEDLFPIFNNKCNIKLKSLNYLHFEVIQTEIDVKILKNIYNNIDKMPNIKYLYFSFIISDINVTKEFYEQLIKKILDLDLKYLFINIENEKLENESKIFKYNFGYNKDYNK